MTDLNWKFFFVVVDDDDPDNEDDREEDTLNKIHNEETLVDIYRNLTRGSTTSSSSSSSSSHHLNNNNNNSNKLTLIDINSRQIEENAGQLHFNGILVEDQDLNDQEDDDELEENYNFVNSNYSINNKLESHLIPIYENTGTL